MITVKAARRPNPQKPSEEFKYYAQTTSSKKVDLNQLADLMSDGSTVRRNDIYAVLVGMVDTSIKLLQDGNRVVLGDLGTFYVSVQSSPVDSIEDFSIHQVKGNKVNYLASQTIKKAMRSVSYSAAKKGS